MKESEIWLKIIYKSLLMAPESKIADDKIQKLFVKFLKASICHIDPG